ncbi:DUF262 domain-containing protein [Hyalangium rubrum]|uniref:DUF262 domain-containing protein n=1 Tax=Hyalangium rubrum TaxID=3103134 RepID=A0ABU5GYH4_9BACT|nr:DUF262 domain-containing protein [Hyalangium sp. s54d21]MDY7226247.1 DUF262 domain-containing protein [Hyalangium sp. s54d21]
MDRVVQGQVRVPPFQRALKWDAADVRKLLDSVWRGFPIGTLLLWKRTTPAEAQTLQLGPVRIDAPQSAEALWVVDGQQRLTALTGTLLHPPPDYGLPPDDFEFYFDLEKEAFVRRAIRNKPLPNWLPMWEVLDSARLLKWLRAHGNALNEETEARAIELGKSFREYQVPGIVVESDSDEVLREIFARTNSAGRPLTQDDIFHALYAARPGETPKGLDEMAAALADLRFGDARELPLRQTVLVVQGVDPTRPVKELSLDKDSLRGAMAKATQALRRTIIFLKKDARIPHVRLLPYSFLVVPLVRFFDWFPQPRPRSRDLLARWLWRTSAAGTLRGGAPPLRAAVRAIVQDNEEKSVQALLTLVSHEKPSFSISTRFDPRTAESRMAALALLAQDPVDLDQGTPLDIETLLLDQGPSLFARVFLQSPLGMKIEPGALANRFVYRGTEGVPLQKLLQVLAQSHSERLSGHIVPEHARVALARGDWKGFFAHRTEALARHVEIYVSKRARWGETDRPSLAALIAEANE